jgi:hypothetical protein
VAAVKAVDMMNNAAGLTTRPKGLEVGQNAACRRQVEWHPGELYPRVGFIVTNMSTPA